MNRNHRRVTRGQSLAEMAVVIPVLVFLLMGGFDASVMISDKITAGYAVRQGARLAAEIGGSQTTNLNTDQVDKQILKNVLAVARTLTSATPTEIDIYKLNQDGQGNLTQDPSNVNRYKLDGTPMGPIPWPASNRDVGNGTSDFIGVTINYTYNWKAGFFSPLGPVRTTAVSYVRLEPQSY